MFPGRLYLLVCMFAVRRMRPDSTGLHRCRVRMMATWRSDGSGGERLGDQFGRRSHRYDRAYDREDDVISQDMMVSLEMSAVEWEKKACYDIILGLVDCVKLLCKATVFKYNTSFSRYRLVGALSHHQLL